MPPQKKNSDSSFRGTSALLDTLRDPGRNLKDRYRGKPLELAERLGVSLPRKPVQIMADLGVYDPELHGPITPGLRDLVTEVCALTVRSAVVVANRGGGKSYIVSFIEFFLWMILDFDALNIGGSEFQADVVYQYLLNLLDDDPFWSTLVRGDPQREKTFTIEDAWIKVLAASQKSVRGQHAGGLRKKKIRGGLLVIDEEAETEEDIVDAALHTINTARPSVSIRASTFHTIGGSFQQVIDHAEEMGYKIYRWDIFDVCSGCECTGPGCQSEEKCFREDHYEDYIDPEDGEFKSRLIHKAYCGGRAMYAEGWIPIEEVVTLWKRIKRNHAKWEVEAMGQRPSSKGYVIRDLTKFAENICEETGAELFQPGASVTIGVDWGTAAAGVSVWQEQFNGYHALLEAELLTDNNQTQIVGKILEFAKKYQKELKEIAADIGGGGNYLNPELEDTYNLPVRGVNFGTEKEGAVAAWNAYNEANKILIPKDLKDFTEQVQNWKRKHGRIDKGDDHLCDTGICYFSQFIERLGLTNIGVPPLTFATGAPAVMKPGEMQTTSTDSIRNLPIAVTLGSRSGRTSR